MRVESTFMQSVHFVYIQLITNLKTMRMEKLKIVLTLGVILILPVVLMPQFFIGLLALTVVCFALRRRAF